MSRIVESLYQKYDLNESKQRRNKKRLNESVMPESTEEVFDYTYERVTDALEDVINTFETPAGVWDIPGVSDFCYNAATEITSGLDLDEGYKTSKKIKSK